MLPSGITRSAARARNGGRFLHGLHLPREDADAGSERRGDRGVHPALARRGAGGGRIATGVPAAVSIRSRRQFAGRRKHTLTLKRVRTHTGAKRADFSHENYRASILATSTKRCQRPRMRPLAFWPGAARSPTGGPERERGTVALVDACGGPRSVSYGGRAPFPSSLGGRQGDARTTR